MKFQELHSITAQYQIPAESIKSDKPSNDNIVVVTGEFYPKKDADEAIKELVDDNHTLVSQIERYYKSEKMAYGVAFHYRQQIDVVQRTLWITRAIRARDMSNQYHNLSMTHLHNGNAEMSKKCYDFAEKMRVVEHKCREKAKNYE